MHDQTDITERMIIRNVNDCRVMDHRQVFASLPHVQRNQHQPPPPDPVSQMERINVGLSQERKEVERARTYQMDKPRGEGTSLSDTGVLCS